MQAVGELHAQAFRADIQPRPANIRPPLDPRKGAPPTGQAWLIRMIASLSSWCMICLVCLLFGGSWCFYMAWELVIFQDMVPWLAQAATPRTRTSGLLLIVVSGHSARFFIFFSSLYCFACSSLNIDPRGGATIDAKHGFLTWGPRTLKGPWMRLKGPWIRTKPQSASHSQPML